MPDRFPGYDVLSKRRSPSWNDATRRVIDQRLAMPRDPHYFTEQEWATLIALCDRIVPQPRSRPPIPVAAMVDHKMANDLTDGYRDHRLPKMQEAWSRGLRALNQEAMTRHGARFHAISAVDQDALLTLMQQGELHHDDWCDMPCNLFFSRRVVHDIVAAYYAHPTSWNEIGFGGPASPRGYVRMGFDKRDPWEAAESKAGAEDKAERKNRDVG
jgi:hypothetical protein